jgi:hypothetical protein
MNRLDGAAEVNLAVARGRNFPGEIVFQDINYSASTFTAAIRQFPDQAGAALASFVIGTPTFAGGNTTFTFTLSDTVTAALPAAPETGDSVVLFWDLIRTSGGVKTTCFYGEFTVYGRAA